MRDRATLLTSLALLSGLAAGSYWMAERARQGDAGPSVLRHEPDYIVERLHMTRMNLNGQVQYTMNAQQMTHFIDDDSTAIDQPRLASTKPDRAVVTVSADRGQVSSGGEQVQLFGNGLLQRAATPTQAAMDVRSAYFLALPDEDIVRTDQAVRVTQAASVVDANSMEYDNGYVTMKLNSLVSGRGHAAIAPRIHSAPTPSKH